ncbi:hypothetical protein GH714_025609 [Hevea brasiliensis]|uniref:FAD-binding domain-containing protein n=1 Tax=Hevea brasiliensis TaxID=3981 RepID=A0A6A6KVF6_HEVBR|nr:hypothetical protein GH714_025609 [Hevea brasiliensis]
MINWCLSSLLPSRNFLALPNVVGIVVEKLNILDATGVKCAILEKSKAFSSHPQAHFINNRSMEVFRKLDGLAEEIRSSQPPVELWRKFIYCTSLTGSIIGSVDHMQPQVISPVSVAHFSQYKLSRLLLKKLEDLNFHVHGPESQEDLDSGPLKGGELLMGHECISINATDQSITATASHIVEGKYMERNIDCSILVGTDGAGSTIRNLVGIELRGEKDLQRLLSIHFFSRDLGQYLLNERPGMLFFIFNTEAIGVLVAHDLKQGEFILQVPFYPPQQNVDDFNLEICEKLIFKLVGRELLDIDVIEIKPWVMHAEVAEKFVNCDNRIILAGDAAHRFPPAGGFGMNTGIQDVHNLAWKIASVMKGIAPSSIIRTYEMERRPIAIFNTALSVQNFKAAMAVPAALGLDPSIANSVSGETSQFGQFQQLSILSSYFRYHEGAVIPDNDSMVGVLEPPTGRRRDYIPSANPGSRLPHMDVRISSNLSSEVTVSTLDLLCGDRVEFLLIVAPLEESYQLARAAFKVAEEFKVSVKVCVLWPADSLDEFEARSKKALTPWKNYIDVVEVRKPSNPSSWWSICQMTDKGAILVRPDEHIAWCVKSGVDKDPVSEMTRVFTAILGVK